METEEKQSNYVKFVELFGKNYLKTKDEQNVTAIELLQSTLDTMQTKLRAFIVSFTVALLYELHLIIANYKNENRDIFLAIFILTIISFILAIVYFKFSVYQSANFVRIQNRINRIIKDLSCQDSLTHIQLLDQIKEKNRSTLAKFQLAEAYYNLHKKDRNERENENLKYEHLLMINYALENMNFDSQRKDLIYLLSSIIGTSFDNFYKNYASILNNSSKIKSNSDRVTKNQIEKIKIYLKNIIKELDNYSSVNK